MPAKRAVVTGAFSFIGSAVAHELLGRGFAVHTLTGRRPPVPTAISAAPLRFDEDHLSRELDGANVLVNTYWIRFPHAGQTFGTAVARSRILLQAARRAGVGRVVHVSVSNASSGEALGYYRGKAEVERSVRALGIPFGIVRPTLVVGPRDVLTSNIAWFLRRFPAFLLPGGGSYRLQPVTLEDTGRIVADAAEGTGDVEMDAAGPEVLSFREYVRSVARAVGRRRPLFGAPGWLSLGALGLLEPWLRDVILTREELEGLRAELLVSRRPPLGRQSVRDWLARHGPELGRRYVNDVERHFGAGTTEPILLPDTG